MPAYAGTTSEISENAIAVRRALVSAIDPVSLVFDRIPEALGLSAVPDRKNLPKQVTNKFAEAVDELDSSYKVLLNWITLQIHQVLGWGPTTAMMKDQFAAVDPSVMDRISDPSMKSFVMKGQAEHASNVQWLESISAALSRQSPRFWSDHTKQDFLDTLKMMKIALKDATRRAYAAESGTESASIPVLIESGDKVLSEEVIRPDADAQRGLENLTLHKLFLEYGMESDDQQLRFLYQQIAKRLNSSNE